MKRQAEIDSPPPYLIFEDLDFEDNLSISFTEEMEYPNGIEFFRNDNLGAQSFWISYQASESTNDFIYNREVNSTNSMSWSIIDVEPSSLKFSLDFDDPTAVSPDQFDPDKLIFSLIRPDLFVGAKSRKPVEVLNQESSTYQFYSTVNILNGESKKSRGHEELIAALEQGIEIAIQSIMIGNTTISLFLSGVFQYLTGLVYAA